MLLIDWPVINLRLEERINHRNKELKKKRYGDSGVISWLCLFFTRPDKAPQLSCKCLVCLCQSFFPSVSKMDTEFVWGSEYLLQQFLSSINSAGWQLLLPAVIWNFLRASYKAYPLPPLLESLQSLLPASAPGVSFVKLDGIFWHSEIQIWKGIKEENGMPT